MTCERFSGEGFDLFICGKKEECFSCGMRARTKCKAEGCGKPLCETHVRKKDGEDRCSRHAPMTVNESMPKPPPWRACGD